MRLFEVDQGAARDVLAVFQGLSNREGQSAKVPFRTVMNLIRPFGLGISTPDALIDLKNQIDPSGEVIQDISDDGTMILKSNTPSQNPPTDASTSQKSDLDRMASHNAELALNKK